jgi:hypothetical protein
LEIDHENNWLVGYHLTLLTPVVISIVMKWNYCWREWYFLIVLQSKQRLQFIMMV